MKKTLCLLAILLFAFSTVSCNRNRGDTVSHESPKAFETAEASPVDQQNTAEETNDGELITPTQYLCYFLGNAEEFSFSYEQIHDAGIFTTKHYYSDGKTALVYSVKDMKDHDVEIREIEKNGFVYYVIPDKGKVVRYQSPAEDILLHEIQNVCMNACSKTDANGEYTIYDYEASLARNESIPATYRFYMSEGTLHQLDIIFDQTKDKVMESYVFLGFSFDPVEKSLFEIPSNLDTEAIDSIRYPDEIPPWWE